MWCIVIHNNIAANETHASVAPCAYIFLFNSNCNHVHIAKSITIIFFCGVHMSTLANNYLRTNLGAGVSNNHFLGNLLL